MLTYDARLATLEEKVEVMRQDIIYKLDDTNSGVAMLKGVTGRQGLDLKEMKYRLYGIETRLERLEEQQYEQGQDIKEMKHRLDGIDQRLDGIDKRFISMEEKFDKRFEQVDKRFEQIDKHLEHSNGQYAQMLQMLTILMNKVV
jgi:tetrahydromethanopterin S-methyltransferase subunit G